MCSMSGFYVTTSDDQLSCWTKKRLQSTSQSQLAPKKVTVTVCWSAARLIRYSFLNPRETVTSEMYAQQIDEMHQNCTPALASLSRKGPILGDNTQPHTVQPSFKSWANWAQVLPHPSHSSDLSPTNDHAFKHLNDSLQGITLPQPGGGRKRFLRVHWIPKHGFLCYRNKQTSFSLTKTCW